VTWDNEANNEAILDDVVDDEGPSTKEPHHIGTVEVHDGMAVEDIISQVIASIASAGMPDQEVVHGQWARGLGTYKLVGDTVSTLPPGYYDLSANDNEIFFVAVTGRTDSLIRFPHAKVDTVISEIEAFWKREEWFKRFGLPYKRGILLYGPPGSGKTCALRLIAKDVVDRGGIVLIWNTNLFAQAYRQVRHVQPETPVVVLMEDLDALLDGRRESEVLNVLDGTEQLHKVIFVATTNYPEHPSLGPRIMNRPSRFDKRIKVGHPDKVGRRMYMDFLLHGEDKDLDIDVDRYVRDTEGMSLAHLKELFVATVLIGSPYENTIKDLKTMHEEKPSSVYDNDDEIPGSSAYR
jgi:AAA+ superfamily predicted ATPase